MDNKGKQFKIMISQIGQLRWLNTVFKRLLPNSPLLLNYYMIWHPFFARVKVNHGRVYSRILVKVCAVAMAMGLVKNKA